MVNINSIRSAIPIIALIVLVIAIALIALKLSQSTDDHMSLKINQEERLEKLTQEAQVTAEEIENYRTMIGTSMDKKKAILILFNSQDECNDFIAAYGSDLNPHTKGVGIIPLMQDEEGGTYYNIAGNEKLENIFDHLNDGEYTKEPFIYSGMFCYLKRLSIDSLVDDDDKLAELIKAEKAQTLIQNQNE